MTALFADLVGSTALAEQMDPEEWVGLVNRAFAVMSESVERYGGTVAQFLGDGILALFGAPTAHEDDPERAVRAALEMRDAIGRATELQIRVGVNTGEVVVGDIASGLRYGYTALGDAVNVAARMQSAADPGEIIITASTFQRLAPLVDADDLGLVAAKGKSAPVHAYRVRSLSLVPRLRADLVEHRGPALGRGQELARLREAVALVRAGRGRAALVTGEPGIGKSRLVCELRDWATSTDAGMTWAEGRCLSYGRELPYHLVLEVVRDLLGVPVASDDQGTSELLSKVLGDRLGEAAAEAEPYIAHLFALPLEPSASSRLEGLDPSALQARYLGALRQVLLASARPGPLVIVCEDVHWADQASVTTLTRLLPLVDEAPLLMLFSSRGERSGPGWELVTELRRHFGDGLVDLRLGALSEADSRQLVGLLLEDEAPPERLVELVVSKSEGNPLFVEEILHSLIERRLLTRNPEGGWTLSGALSDLEIPDSIHGLLLDRIDRLPDGARDLLKVASVIGRRFSLRMLDAVAERLGLVGGRTELGVLEGAGLLEVASVEPVLEYAFRHPLLHEAAYRSLLRQQRRRLHRVVGEVLAEVVGDRDGELAAVLASHFEQAGDLDRAVDHLIAAGEHALRRLANREALLFYERAAAAVPPEPLGPEEVDRRLRLLIGLGRAQHRVRGSDEARATFARAAELARTHDRPERLAEATLGRAEAWVVWDTEGQLVDPLEEALDRLPEAPSPLRARVLARLAQALYAQGSQQRRERFIDEAEEVARHSGAEAALAEVLLATRPLLGPDDLEERLSVDGELIAIGERTGDLRRAADGHGWRLVDVLERGDIEEADRELERHAELAEELGEPLYQRDTVMWRAMRALLAGQYAQAEQLMQEARRIGEAAGDPGAKTIFLGQRWFSLLEQGRPEELRALLAELPPWVEDHHGWTSGLALIMACLGRWGEARELFERMAGRGFASLPRDAIWLDVMVISAEACAALGDAERAAVLHRLLVPYRDRHNVADRATACSGSVERQLGLLATTMARYKDASEHFEAALAHNQALRSPPLVARTRAAYASMLARRRETGDLDRAAELHRQAAATARKLGMTRLLDELEAA
ncbi:MAG: AAA family ATPase [Actinomycetota bacterium]|nr:AAA family ATPase [Actinomycetota bacterium]